MTKQVESKFVRGMTTEGGCLVIVLSILWTLSFWSFDLYKGWQWFIVPTFDAPAIDYATMVGIFIMGRILTGSVPRGPMKPPPTPEDPEPKPYLPTLDDYWASAITPVWMLGILWLVYLASRVQLNS